MVAYVIDMMQLNHSEAINKIIDWLQAFLVRTKAQGFVIGLSGGIDSSTTAVLCRRVTRNVLGLILPCHSSPSAENDARRIAEQFDISILKHDLSLVYDNMVQTFNSSELNPTASKVVLGNIKARLRMISIYFHANRLNRLVVGAGNGIEIMLGYFTKFGDGGADLWPIGDLLKRDVRQIAAHLAIPSDIIRKPPSADLWPGQTDETEMGVSYDVLDQIIGGDPLSQIKATLQEKVTQRIQKALHKNLLLSAMDPPNVCILQNLAEKSTRLNLFSTSI